MALTREMLGSLFRSDVDEAVELIEQLPAIMRRVNGLKKARENLTYKGTLTNDPSVKAAIQEAVRSINRAEVEGWVFISTAQEMVQKAIDSGDISADDVPSYVINGLDGLGEPITITTAVAVAIIAIAATVGIGLLIDQWAKAKPHIEYAESQANAAAAALKRWQDRVAAGDRTVSDAPPVPAPDAAYLEQNESTISKSIGGIITVVGILGGIYILSKSFGKGNQ